MIPFGKKIGFSGILSDTARALPPSSPLLPSVKALIDEAAPLPPLSRSHPRINDLLREVCLILEVSKSKPDDEKAQISLERIKAQIAAYRKAFEIDALPARCRSEAQHRLNQYELASMTVSIQKQKTLEKRHDAQAKEAQLVEILRQRSKTAQGSGEYERLTAQAKALKLERDAFQRLLAKEESIQTVYVTAALAATEALDSFVSQQQMKFALPDFIQLSDVAAETRALEDERLRDLYCTGEALEELQRPYATFSSAADDADFEAYANAVLATDKPAAREAAHTEVNKAPATNDALLEKFLNGEEDF